MRNGEPVKLLSNHTVHLCIDIMSPIVNIEVGIVAKLFNNALNYHLELTEEINMTHIRIKPSEALLSIICQGDVIEFKITNTEDEDIIEEVCSHIIRACDVAVKELSVDKKHIIKYNFQVLCKNDGYAEVPYNIYHLHHTLPDDYLCHDCFKAGILDHQVRAWNKALTKNPIDPDYLLKKDISDADIVRLSKEIADYPMIAIDAFASELHVQFQQDFNDTPAARKWTVVRDAICRWLNQEDQLTSTSLKTDLAKKLMKLHNAFEKQTLELKKYPRIKFNVLARRLDIQVCSNNQLSDWIERSSSNYDASTTEISKSSTVSHQDLHDIRQKKETQLTHQLEAAAKEKKESKENITRLQTKLQEYRQQLLKTTDISSYLPKLAIILEPVQEDWEQLGLQLNIDESVLTDIRNKGDSTEQINCLLEEWALKEGILIQLEEALLRIGKKEVIPDLHALQEKESTVIDTSEQISTKSNDKSDINKVLAEKQEEIEKLTREKEILREELDTLKQKILTVTESEGVIPIGDTLFLLRGSSHPQHFNWEKYGISFSAPEGILPPSETCEVAITALAGGEFEFPEDSELVSAVYAISISKPLLKPLTINIQHCVLLETLEQCNSLQFVRAPFKDATFPYQFKVLAGGHFTPENKYGSISLTQFCLIGISMEENEGGEEVNTSDKENDSSQNSHNSEEENTSDKEDGSSQKSEDPHISEESGKEVTDETNDDKKDSVTKNLESDEVRHKPKTDSDSASQNAAARPDKKANISFFCKVYFEDKNMFQWQVMFTAVKNLDALHQYIKKCHPHAEENQSIDLTLKLQTDVEFDVQNYRDEIPHGWEIRPRRLPLMLRHTSIKKFGSGMYSEPPSCFIDVYADEGNNTAKKFHYKVPILGVEQCILIFINLTLGQRCNTTGVQITAPSKDPMLSGDKVNEVIKIIQDVVTKRFAALDGLLKASIKSFAVDMYSHSLISETTKDTANFNDMMREFNSGMDFIRDSHKLVKHCQLFLQSLVKQGGPHKDAASSIAEEWTANIKEKLNINIEFDIE